MLNYIPAVSLPEGNVFNLQKHFHRKYMHISSLDTTYIVSENDSYKEENQTVEF